MLVTLINVYSLSVITTQFDSIACVGFGIAVKYYKFCCCFLLFFILQPNSIAFKLTQTLKMMLKHTYAKSMEILHRVLYRLSQMLRLPLSVLCCEKWLSSPIYRFCIRFWSECLSCSENLYDYKVGIIMQPYYVIHYKQFLLFCLDSALSIDGNSFFLLYSCLLAISSDSALFRIEFWECWWAFVVL